MNGMRILLLPLKENWLDCYPPCVLLSIWFTGLSCLRFSAWPLAFFISFISLLFTVLLAPANAKLLHIYIQAKTNTRTFRRQNDN